MYAMPGYEDIDFARLRGRLRPGRPAGGPRLRRRPTAALSIAARRAGLRGPAPGGRPRHGPGLVLTRLATWQVA